MESCKLYDCPSDPKGSRRSGPKQALDENDDLTHPNQIKDLQLSASEKEDDAALFDCRFAELHGLR